MYQRKMGLVAAVDTNKFDILARVAHIVITTLLQEVG
jgi:hypothetical protein